MKLVNIGFGNMVSAKRIVCVTGSDSAPMKRVIQQAKTNGNLIDATFGRKTRAVIFTDSNHIITSAVQPETIANRLESKTDDIEIGENLDE